MTPHANTKLSKKMQKDPKISIRNGSNNHPMQNVIMAPHATPSHFFYFCSKLWGFWFAKASAKANMRSRKTLLRSTWGIGFLLRGSSRVSPQRSAACFFTFFRWFQLVGEGGGFASGIRKTSKPFTRPVKGSKAERSIDGFSVFPNLATLGFLGSQSHLKAMSPNRPIFTVALHSQRLGPCRFSKSLQSLSLELLFPSFLAKELLAFAKLKFYFQKPWFIWFMGLPGIDQLGAFCKRNSRQACWLSFFLLQRRWLQSIL